MTTQRAVAWVWAILLASAVLSATQERPRHGRLFPPEDLGVLEGPDRDAWQMPDAVMDALGVADGSSVADIGAGGGWFTVRLARRVGPNGTVYAQDVQPQMLEAIRRRVEREGLRNVRTVKGDAANPHLPPSSVDAIIIVDAYHEFENPVALLGHLARALKPGGRLGVVNFTKEGGGPGPPAEERVEEGRVVREAALAGLTLLRRETFLPFQYYLIFVRNGETAPALTSTAAETGESPERGQHGRGEAELDQVGGNKRHQPELERRSQPVP
jgi:ubiquinone/menaquinone biosynthesis C-methylase UbiE